MMRLVLSIFILMTITACNDVGLSDVEYALETQWENDARAITEGYELEIPGMEKGAMRGTAETLRTVRKTAKNFGYAGELAAGVAGEVMSEGGRLASEFGVEGADEFHEVSGLANADDWTVSNLAILSERMSGEEYVAKVRYDLSAMVNGEERSLRKDLAHTLRLMKKDGDWVLQLPNKSE